MFFRHNAIAHLIDSAGVPNSWSSDWCWSTASGPHSRRWASQGNFIYQSLFLPGAHITTLPPELSPPQPNTCLWKNCLPQNQSLVPKRLGTTGLQDSVNITFICTGKPKNLCDLLYWDIYFIAVIWTKSTISLRYARLNYNILLFNMYRITLFFIYWLLLGFR